MSKRSLWRLSLLQLLRSILFINMFDIVLLNYFEELPFLLLAMQSDQFYFLIQILQASVSLFLSRSIVGGSIDYNILHSLCGLAFYHSEGLFHLLSSYRTASSDGIA